MRRARVVLMATLACLVLATPVAAAKPTMERVTLDFSGPDEFLTDACGFDVSLQEAGHITFRFFTDADGNPTPAISTTTQSASRSPASQRACGSWTSASIA